MKKKSFLLPIFAGLLLSACKFTIFGKTIYLFEKKPDSGDPDSGEVIPEDTNKHATKLTLDPSAPFYLKVGEAREISVGFDQTPTLDSEKLFYWSFSGDKISINVDGNTGSRVKGGQRCTVTGLKAGTVTLNVTNTYDQALTKDFLIRVIDFDEEKDYLWQYKSEDRKQFGYNSQSAKQGIKEGDAVLSGLTWHFTRSSTTSLQSSMGAVGFGKNQEPETAIHLETMTDRVVKDLVIEAASANSLATMTIKVNDVGYSLNSTDLADGKIKKPENNIISQIHTTGVGEEKGKIEIDFSTPPYIPAQAEDINYKVPGALYLKSIWIHFGEADPAVTTETFNFKEMYDDPEDGIFDFNNEDVREETISKNDFTVYLNKVKKESTGESEKIPGYAHTNGYIDIKLSKPNEVISSIEFKFTYGAATSKNVYYLNKSKSGGSPFEATGIGSDNGLLKTSIFDEHCNALRLTTKNSYNVGLEYLIIKTKEGVNPTIKEIAVPEQFEPTKKDYVVGEEFNPAGLSNLTIVYNEENIESDVLPISELEWFDGPSYSTEPSKTLLEGTTFVVGVFRGEIVVTIDGLTVTEQSLQLTLVKDIASITSTDKIYIVSPSYKVFAKGSTKGDVKTSSGVGTIDATTVGESFELSAMYKDDYFTVKSESSTTYSMKSLTHYLNITSSGNLGASGSAAVAARSFTISIDSETGIATCHISVVKDGVTLERNLHFSGSTFELVDDDSNIAFYKVS